MAEGLIALGVSFTSLGLDRRICKALSKQGFEHPTLVQEKAIPLALQGKDIIARAKTGSGKTAAYAIPIIQKILTAKETKKPKKGVKCAVLLPTRELCSQVTQVFNDLTSYCKGQITTSDLSLDAAEFSVESALRDKPDVIVTTPSRLLSFLKEKQIDLKVCFDTVVVDEADLTLSLGYEEDIQGIATYLPKVYQGFLMSATLDDRTKGVRDILLHNSVTLHLQDPPSSVVAPLLTEALVKCADDDKFLVVYALLRLGLIPPKVIIFVNSIERCIKLKLFLDRFTVQCIVLNSELPRESRLHIINQFNSGVFNFLIATDELIEDLGVELKDLKAEAELAKESKGAKVEEIHDVDADDGRNSKKRKIAKKEESEKEDEEEEDSEDSDDSEDEKDVSMSIKEEGDDDDVPVAKSNDSQEVTTIKDEDDEDVKDEIKEEEDDKKKKRKKRGKKEAPKDTEYSVARGVDFKGVQTVINFDFPNSTKAYIHRIGRTARAGAKGLAVSLVAPGEDEENLNKLVVKRNKLVPEFGFQLKSIEAFRYRCDDVLGGISANQIKVARAEMIRKELLTSKKLKEHFKENAQEKAMLMGAHMVSVLPLAAAKRNSLRNIPNYLVPKSLVANVNQNPNESFDRKKKSGPRRKRDPILGKRKK